MSRTMVAAAWSVLAFLLLSKPAFARQDSATSKLFVLNSADSNNLMARMKFPAKREVFRGNSLSSKRFKTSDGAISIDCAYHSPIAGQGFPIVCSAALDLTKSVPGVTIIKPGYVTNSSIFRILAKQDVASILANIVGTSGPYYTTEQVIVPNPSGNGVTVSRFVLSCPRDWVFDVVACEGHIISR